MFVLFANTIYSGVEITIPGLEELLVVGCALEPIRVNRVSSGARGSWNSLALSKRGINGAAQRCLVIIALLLFCLCHGLHSLHAKTKQAALWLANDLMCTLINFFFFFFVEVLVKSGGSFLSPNPLCALIL